MGARVCSCGKNMTIINESLIREVNGKKTIITNVPVLFCENCKEVLYKARTIKKIDELLKAYPERDTISYGGSSIDIEIIKKLSPIIDGHVDDLDKPISFAYMISVISRFYRQTA